MSHQIDYNKLFFPVKTITKIVGQPTTDSIAQLKKELTKNATSVNSILGGGRHGHLFLVLSAFDFNAIPGTAPFVRPVHPGALQIPANSTAAQISHLERIHQEATNLFDRVTGVELALLAQVEEALDPIYLSPIINVHTQSFDRNLEGVLTYLASAYASSDEPLSQREMKLNQFLYDPRDPIADVWKKLQDHAEAAERQGVPVTDAWKIDKVLFLLNKTQHFTEDIKTWKKKPEADKTWINLLSYFNQCHRLLLESNVLTVQEQERQQLAANLANTLNEALQANSSTSPDIASSLADIIRRLQHLESRTATNTQNDPNNQNRRERRVTEYCWTHGGCNHKSSECNNKAEGHQDAATKDNRMGGSTRFISRL